MKPNADDYEHRAAIDDALSKVAAALKQLADTLELARKAGLHYRYGDGFFCPNRDPAENRYYDGIGHEHIRIKGGKPLQIVVGRYYEPMKLSQDGAA